MATQRELFEDFFREETSTRACELVGPNALAYESLVECLTEDRAWRFAVAKEWRRRLRPSANEPHYQQPQGAKP